MVEAGRVPSVAVTWTLDPSRSTLIVSLSPGRCSLITAVSWFASSIVMPSTEVITSPDLRPAVAAGRLP